MTLNSNPVQSQALLSPIHRQQANGHLYNKSLNCNLKKQTQMHTSISYNNRKMSYFQNFRTYISYGSVEVTKRFSDLSNNMDLYILWFSWGHLTTPELVAAAIVFTSDPSPSIPINWIFVVQYKSINKGICESALLQINQFKRLIQ